MSPASHEPRPIAIALSGLLALAIAMGIGRFAFTPLLPMMLHDGVVDLPGASWLATANYLGYSLGAMACAVQPAVWRRSGRAALLYTRVVRVGLVATVLLTLGMALPPVALWPVWRFLAGVASALVFVFVSGWCLARLAALGAPALAGIMYVGPGLGITLSGLAATAMVARGVSAAAGWAVFALLAAALVALAWPQLRGTVRASASAAGGDSPPPSSTIATFTLAYGLAGFGYIVTATFLPVIARQALPRFGVAGSVLADLRHRCRGRRAADRTFADATGPSPPADGLLRDAGHRRHSRRVAADAGRLRARQPAVGSAVYRHHAVRDAGGPSPAAAPSLLR